MHLNIDGVALEAFFDEDGDLTELYAGDVDILPMIDTICGGNLAAFNAEIDRAKREDDAERKEDETFDRMMGRAMRKLKALSIR